MRRDFQIQRPELMNDDELHWRTAFHEAGHAAAIHLANKRKNLPPVFFEIQIKRPSPENRQFSAKVIDGNLIQSLPMAVIESFSSFVESSNETHSCQRAYEADIFNLLVGPLAEAKYISIRDNELININLLSFNALHNYGGLNDLERANQYLESFIASPALRNNKLVELLSEAYDFVDNRQNWKCILNLAHYILDSPKEVIYCDEAIAILENCFH